MAYAKRSSHPSIKERQQIDADRQRNYSNKKYKIASDGSLRDSQGRFVNGTMTTGGFDYHPEHRRKGGGWDKAECIPYQYRRFWAMEKEEFFALGKRYRVLPFKKNDNPDDYPPEEHTVVEETALLAIFHSLTSLAYAREISQRVEGRCGRMTGWHLLARRQELENITKVCYNWSVLIFISTTGLSLTR